MAVPVATALVRRLEALETQERIRLKTEFGRRHGDILGKLTDEELLLLGDGLQLHHEGKTPTPEQQAVIEQLDAAVKALAPLLDQAQVLCPDETARAALWADWQRRG